MKATVGHSTVGHCLLVLSCCFRLGSSYCWQAGANPYFIDKPTIQQVSLSMVRISWADIVEDRECADQFLVKYWQNNMPQGFQLSDTVPTDQNYVDVEASSITSVFWRLPRFDRVEGVLVFGI